MNKDGKNIRNIGDGIELPLAGCAIVVVVTRVVIVVTRTFVMVMVNHAEEQRHAQVEQAYDRSCHPRFHHAMGNLDSPRENVKLTATQAPCDITETVRGLVWPGRSW